MVRCCSPSNPENPACMDGAPALPSQFRHRALWGSLTVVLLTVVIALSVTGHLCFRRASPQVIRVKVSEQTVDLVNQSATVDQRNDVVTYSVTPCGTNHTSTVLFDVKQGVMCYKPDSQNACFLRKMDSSDFDNLQAVLSDSTHKVSQFWVLGNETQRQTELLEVLGDQPVDVSSLQEPFQSTCLHRATYWTRKALSPPKRRLIYFCIDICFPSNMCVSVCFYYLPE